MDAPLPLRRFPSLDEALRYYRREHMARSFPVMVGENRFVLTPTGPVLDNAADVTIVCRGVRT